MNPNYHPINTAELFDSVFDMYKKNATSYFLMNGLSYALLLLLSVIFIVAFMISGSLPVIVDAIFFIDNATISGSNMLMMLVIVCIYMIFLSVGLLFIESGSIMITKNGFYREKKSFSDTLKATISVIPAAFTVLLSQIFIILMLFVIIGAVLTAIYFFMPSYWMWHSVFTELDIGAVLLLILIGLAILFLYMLVWVFISLAIPVAIYEKRYFFSAILRSYQLVKKDFWKIFGANIGWWLIYMGIYYNLTAILDIAIGILTLLNDNFTPSLGFVLIILQTFQGIYAAIITFFMIPLNGIFSSLLYFNQRAKYEGLDVQVQLEQLSKLQNQQEIKKFEDGVYEF